MKIPSCFFGKIADVKKECRKVAKKLIKGATFEEATAGYEMLDTDDYPDAIIYLGYQHQFFCEEESFHLFYLHDIINSILYNKFDFKTIAEYKDSIFNKIKDNAVACLCVTADMSFISAPNAYTISSCDKRKRWKPYLQAMAKFWDTYKTLEKRFDDYVSNDGKKLIYSLRNVVYIIANLGTYVYGCGEYMFKELENITLSEFIDKYKVMDFDENLIPIN